MIAVFHVFKIHISNSRCISVLPKKMSKFNTEDLAIVTSGSQVKMVMSLKEKLN